MFRNILHEKTAEKKQALDICIFKGFFFQVKIKTSTCKWRNMTKY